MESVLTVVCKLEIQPEQAPQLEDTLSVFRDACQYINPHTPPNLTHRLALQALIYREVRERFGLSANLAIQAIRRVAANRKTAQKKGKKVKGFSPTSIPYDARIFSFRERDLTVSITWVGGRARFRLGIGDYQLGLLKGSNPTSATLVKRKEGTYFIQIQIKSTPPVPLDPRGYLGADLGRREIVVTSDDVHYSSETIEKKRDHYARLRAVLQRKAAKGTRRCRRRCRQLQKRLSGKESRFQRAVNHRISKGMVETAKTSQRAVALEDLTGIRERTNEQPRSKEERRRSNSWAFYQLRQFIEYKAVRAGVPVILAPPAYTSQTCHCCLHIRLYRKPPRLPR